MVAATATTGSGALRADSMLLRHFIYTCLYSPKRGYFQPVSEADLPLRRSSAGGRDPNLKFASRDAWESHVRDLYRSAPRTWLTPSELFSPHYGRAVANCLSLVHDHDIIVEVGGGNGTAALDALDWLEATAPDKYERTQYHIVEISAPFVLRQREQLQRHVDAGRCMIHHGSAVDDPIDIVGALTGAPAGAASGAVHQASVAGERRAGGDAAARAATASEAAATRGRAQPSAAASTLAASASTAGAGTGASALPPVGVVALELFDNLAHDAVIRDRDTREWQQAYADENGRFSHAPLTDELILDACRMWGVGPYATEWDTERERALEQPSEEEIAAERAETAREANATGATGGADAAGASDDALRGATVSSFERVRRAFNALVPAHTYVPTNATRLLRNLYRSFPNGHTLLVSDFDSFPDALPADGPVAPVLQAFGHSRTVDWTACKPGHHDIMFSTSFDGLWRAHRRVSDRPRMQQQSICTHREWWQRYAPTNPSGYNPVLDSFANVSTYLGKTRPGAASGHSSGGSRSGGAGAGAGA